MMNHSSFASSILCCFPAGDIWNNVCVIVNNEFMVTDEVFTNDFHEIHAWKSLENHIAGDQKSLFKVTNALLYILNAIFMSWTHNSAKNNHRSLIPPLSPRTVSSDVALWRLYGRSVASSEREVRMWRHIRRFFFHVQIGANAIFTSEKNNCEYRFLTNWYSRLIV